MDRHVPDAADEFDDAASGDHDDQNNHGCELDAFDFLHDDAGAHEASDQPLFTIANPPRTVAVTVHLDGRVNRVELSPAAAGLTEFELAEEVVLIAELAKQNARSAQYTAALDSMRDLGHDVAGTRDFLTRNLDLPSPEDALAAREQVFATRYQGDHD